MFYEIDADIASIVYQLFKTISRYSVLFAITDNNVTDIDTDTDIECFTIVLTDLYLK